MTTPLDHNVTAPPEAAPVLLGGDYRSHEDCPDAEKHTKCPTGYLAWFDWAEKKAKTHTNVQCPTCKFWTNWERKP